MTYLHRILETKLSEFMGFFSVVGLTGPRQAGKSTLIRHQFKDYTYVTFDNRENIQLFYDDPQRFMRIYNHKVIFDEVQKVPEIFDEIKAVVDNDRDSPGKYLISGSSQFVLNRKISETLAGRIGKLELLPYQFAEIQANHQEALYRGSYPEMVQKNYNFFEDWMASYISTYLERDVRDLANIGDLRDFQRLLHLLAANTSQILNMSQYARDIGVDVKTIKRWISIMEASYIIFLLPPFYQNFGKRIVKSPKVYFYDVGIVSYLTGITNQTLFEQGPMYGAIFENYVVAEIMKMQRHCVTHNKLYYYRTSSGEEVDLIIDHKQSKTLIEIKASETFRPQGVKTIMSLLSDKDTGYLLYRGQSKPFVDNMHIASFAQFLKQLPCQ